MEDKMFRLDKKRNALRIKPRGIIDKILTILVIVIFGLLLLSCFGGPNFLNMPYGDDDPIGYYE